MIDKPATESAPRRVLILGDSAEGADLARRLAACPEFIPCLMPTGGDAGAGAGAASPAPAGPGDLLGPIRAAAAVVLATDPWAVRLTAAAADVAAALGRPCLRLLAPAWRPGPCDRWIAEADPRRAAGAILRHGLRCPLVVSGALSDAALAALRGCRPVRTGPDAAAAALSGHPGIDSVVMRNQGGSGGLALLQAARQRALPVIMLGRPEQPVAADAGSAAEAFDRIREKLLLELPSRVA
ncbi:MAG: hypothetical protein KatS3mg118_0077 [Paracoccaceae bacterium]|nr:MAG: hypothetical protein KatS3mg118_0077 [Paracoccaceae bacterium]